MICFAEEVEIADGVARVKSRKIGANQSTIDGIVAVVGKGTFCYGLKGGVKEVVAVMVVVVVVREKARTWHRERDINELKKESLVVVQRTQFSYDLNTLTSLQTNGQK